MDWIWILKFPIQTPGGLYVGLCQCFLIKSIALHHSQGLCFDVHGWNREWRNKDLGITKHINVPLVFWIFFILKKSFEPLRIKNYAGLSKAATSLDTSWKVYCLLLCTHQNYLIKNREKEVKQAPDTLIYALSMLTLLNVCIMIYMYYINQTCQLCQKQVLPN